jgi:uncharacterized protein YyaL (SSP411 family)
LNSSQANHLANEKSPYLQQHAFNPVDWYPWGDEAFEKARREDKPILLSIGYSTCHWCHVMEHESFEDSNTAQEMNKCLVCIKVDREERPDVDALYMTALSAMTGQGGWPLNVFLTPELKPFYGGTYFPAQPSYGRPSFIQLVVAIGKSWKDPEARKRIFLDGDKMAAALLDMGKPAEASKELNASWLDGAFHALERSYDRDLGGFGHAPKFPMPVNFGFLLRYGSRVKNGAAQEMVLQTLRAMAQGGIHDHLGGGFARYSTDERWHVPHFEKMLYDNAQLAISYLEAYQVSQDRFFADVARNIFSYELRDMLSPEGAFYSAEDADSLDESGQKVEGAFYVWSHAEILEILGPQAGARFCQAYGVLEHGNVQNDPHGEFHDKNVLYRETTASVAEAELAQSRNQLLQIRSKRPRPQRDDKLLSSWNGMLISAFAKGWQVLGEWAYLDAALNAERFLWDRMFDRSEKILYRRWMDGERKVEGTADDYAQLTQAELDLYESNGDAEHLKRAIEISGLCQEYFYDPGTGAYFMTRLGHDKNVLVRFQETQDNVEASAASVQIMNLLRLAGFTSNSQYRQDAEAALKALGGVMEKSPRAAGQMLCDLEMALSPSLHVVVVGTGPLATALRAAWAPHRILITMKAGEKSSLSFAENFAMKDGKETAYICVALACKLPTNDAAEALRMLQGLG